jgi:hypothetical protein
MSASEDPVTTAFADTLGNDMQHIASYEAGTDDAASANIFANEGTNLSRGTRRRRESPEYRARLMQTMRLYQRVVEGDRRAAIAFQEAMSTSDFTFLFGDIIDRQLLASYQVLPVQWPSIARRGRVRDFRTVKRFTLDGGAAVLDQVKQLDEYKLRSVADGSYSYNVNKYGNRIAVSWETLVNDDLDAMADLPQRLGMGAKRSEERFAASLFTTSSGPNSTFFSAANKNIISPAVTGTGAPTNPALTIQALQYAMQTMQQQVDNDGAPIFVQGYVLVVPPALEVAANNIINATEILAATGGGDGTGNDQLRAINWMRNRVTVSVNPWLPIINTTNGNSAWYLFANPDVGRPALEVGFLIGHETPELWVKSPNAQRVGGGPVAPEEGDFDHDAIQYRVRHVFGGSLLDPRSGLASNGTGS